MKLQSKLRRTVILVLCLLLVAGVFASCGKKEEKAKEKNITVTDMAGREVTVPTDAKKFVAIGRERCACTAMWGIPTSWWALKIWKKRTVREDLT